MEADISNKDVQILQHIVRYCHEIDITADVYQVTKEKIENNFIIRNAICMPIQQIGELANHLTDEFTSSHKEIPWRSVVGMRNIFAHEYSNIDAEMVFGTVQYDIPGLKIFCFKVLKEHNKEIPKPESLNGNSLNNNFHK